MANKKPENLSFEAAMAELQTIVQQMDQGELSLEDSLKQFERGVQLVSAGQSKLQQAEQKVQVLMQQQGQAQLQPFADGEN